MKNISLVCHFILFFVFSSMVMCNDLGYANETKRDSGFEVIKNEAERGDAEAQCMLGIIYYNGRMVEKDLNLSFKWFEKSALQDYPPAMTYLGEMYKLGEGTARNPEKARHWLEKAAAKGEREAKLELGTLKE